MEQHLEILRQVRTIKFFDRLHDFVISFFEEFAFFRFKKLNTCRLLRLNKFVVC